MYKMCISTINCIHTRNNAASLKCYAAVDFSPQFELLLYSYKQSHKNNSLLKLPPALIDSKI